MALPMVVFDPLSDEYFDNPYETYRRITDAVRRQDPEEASPAMADHIRLVSDVPFLRVVD